jgi:hypothetical protein
MEATTAAYRGVPEWAQTRTVSRTLKSGEVRVSEYPTNLMQTGALAEENGWTVRPTYVRRNVTLRFSRAGWPSIWASWVDGSFSRAYAQTAQRLSLRDLQDVLQDPSLLTDVDPDDPFGHAEASPLDGSL